LARIKIDENLCKGCALCTILCPEKLIKIGDKINETGYFYAVFEDNGSCKGCALCAKICPEVAIEVWK